MTRSLGVYISDVPPTRNFVQRKSDLLDFFDLFGIDSEAPVVC